MVVVYVSSLVHSKICQGVGVLPNEISYTHLCNDQVNQTLCACQRRKQIDSYYSYMDLHKYGMVAWWCLTVENIVLIFYLKN